MALEKWLLERVRLASLAASDAVKQFAIEAFANSSDDEFSEILEEFTRVGVWGLQHPLPIFKTMREGKPFSALVGMRPYQTLHLGHLTLMRELSWLIQQGGQPVFIFAGYEAGKFLSSVDAAKEMARFGKTYLKFIGTELPKTAVGFSDRACDALQVLESRVAEHLSIRKILQLYGWDEGVSIAVVRMSTMMAASFLFPAIEFPNRPTLVLSDIHQLTHAEATKIAARQLKIPIPSYSYRMLLPSLEGPAQRMTVKNQKSAIFLNESKEQVKSKLQRSFSGGRLTPEEQRRIGGDPHRCSFFAVAEVLQPCETTKQMYQDCVSGSSLCGECKKKHILELMEKIRE